jgi:hypothetical protein
MAVPGVEAPALSDEATAVRYFAPDKIPWDDLAFHTTREALADWIASRLK